MGNEHSAPSSEARLFEELFGPASYGNSIDIPDMCGVLKLGIAPAIQLLEVLSLPLAHDAH